jgi:hypothetical protein
MIYDINFIILYLYSDLNTKYYSGPNDDYSSISFFRLFSDFLISILNRLESSNLSTLTLLP